MATNSRKKWLFSILFVVIAIAFAFIASLPKILSTDWGKNQLTSYLSHSIKGNITIGELQLSWCGPQKISSLVLNDPKDNSIAAVNRIEADVSLLKLIFSNSLPKAFLLDGLSATLLMDQQGNTNLLQAISAPDESDLFLNQKPLAIHLDNVNSSLQRDLKKGSLAFDLSGQTIQGQQSGRFQINLALLDFHDGSIDNLQHLLANDLQGNVKVDANIVEFPIELIEQILAFKGIGTPGFLTKLLGNSIDLSIAQKPSPGSIELEAKAKTPTAEASFTAVLDFLKPSAPLSLNLSGQFGTSDAYVTDLIGSQLDFSIKGSYANNLDIVLGLSSERFKVSDAHFSVRDSIVLAEPAVLEGSLSAQFINTFLDEAIAFRIAKSIPWKLDIAKLSIPFQDFKRLQLGAHLHADDIAVTALPAIGDATLRAIDLHLEQNTPGTLKANLTCSLSQNSPTGPLAVHIGPEVKLAISSLIGTNALLVKELNLNLQSALLNASINGRLSPQNHFVMTTPASIHYILTPATVNAFAFGPELLQPTPVMITIEPHYDGFNLADLNALRLKGVFSLTDLSVLTGKQSQTASLKNVRIPWELDVPKGSLKLSISGTTQLSNQAQGGDLSGIVSVKNMWGAEGLHISESTIDAAITVKQLPVIFLELLEDKEALVTLLGPTLDLDIKGYFSPANTVDQWIEIALQSDGVQAKGAFSLHPQLSLRSSSSPAFARVKLTPSRFAVLQKQWLSPNQELLQLAENVLLELQIPRMDFDWKEMLEGRKEKALKGLALEMNLAADHLKIASAKTRRILDLQPFQATLKTASLNEQVALAINGSLSSGSSSSAPLNIDIAVKNVVTAFKDGAGISALGIHGHLHGEQLPVGVIALLFDPSGQLSLKARALVGETAKMNIQTSINHLQGTVKASLVGESGNFNLDGMLQDGYLTLNSPLTAQAAVTPQLGKYVLEPLLPLLGGMVSADQPIQIVIDPASFAIPLSPFNMNNVQIGQASITMGKVHLTNQGVMRTILALLNEGNRDLISVWFTPLYIQMYQGALTIHRLDFLINDHYPIATWGTIDFPRDRVNMVVGITAKAIAKAFKVPSFGAQEILQLPLRGTLANASLDKTKAAAKISALIAALSGPQGMIVGAVLHIASGGLTEEKPPEPTTKPLPWDNGEDQDGQSSNQTQGSTNPIKQIEKGASNLLKQLFH